MAPLTTFLVRDARLAVVGCRMDFANYTRDMPTKLPAGVVTGDAYRELVSTAIEGGYAFPAVNVIGTHSINAALEAAAAAESDLIIQMSNSGATRMTSSMVV